VTFLQLLRAARSFQIGLGCLGAWCVLGAQVQAAPAAPGSALTALKQVQISGGDQIDLLFDKKVDPAQIKLEFFNDIVQLVIQDASVYPAKISSVSGTVLSKVFAYQYSPRVVRTRLTVRGKAEDFQTRFKMTPHGRIVTLTFPPLVTESGAGAKPAPLPKQALVTPPVSSQSAGPHPASQGLDVQEKKLLEKVQAGVPSGSGAGVAPPALESQGTLTGASSASKPVAVQKASGDLGLKKTGPSAKRAVFVLLGMVGVLLAVAWVVSRAKKASQSGSKSEGRTQRKLLQAIGRFTGKSSTEGPEIQVISNHSLGAKKSIAVVKVGGQMLVLGVSEDSINLITPLEKENFPSSASGVGDLDLMANGQGASEDFSSPGALLEDPEFLGAPLREPSFREMVDSKGFQSQTPPVVPTASRQATARTNAASPSIEGSKRTAHSVIRSQIKSRLEGLKSL
jgi:flagellar biogenesis protein FliO